MMLLLGILMGKKASKRAKQLKALGNKTIPIGNYQYIVARMTSVDQKICKGQTDKAKQELMKNFKATEAEADAIIANWERITTPDSN